MRIAVLVAGAVLLSGCATMHRPFNLGSARPARPGPAKAATKATAAESAKADSMVAADTPAPVKIVPATEKAAAVPMMGFRPMRGQATGGI